MGVDYTGNYGIGVKLNDVDFDDLEDVDCMDEYCEEIGDTDLIDLEYFVVGSESYGGATNRFYLCISEPFKNGIENGVDGLVDKIKIFKKYLKDKNVQYEGDVDCFGGLNVW